MAGSNGPIAGTVFFSAAGRRLAAVGEFAYQLSGVNREFKYGADGPHGTKEKPMAGNITGKVRNMPDLDLAALGAIVDETVQLELINGKTIVARNAIWSGDPPKADAEEAEVEVKFESADVSEQ